jgi:hypothetical protein
MKRSRRVMVIPLAALVLAVGLGAPPTMAAADNAAVAINHRDDAFVWRHAFKITRSNGDEVLEANGAAAVSQCERCRTAAVAFQVVIATGPASTVAPENLAFAFNDGCLSCATYAGAFQLIVTPRDQIHFTTAGNEQIALVREELQALIGSATFGPTLEEIDAFNAHVDVLFDRLVSIVHAEMVLAGGGGLSVQVDLERAA